MVQSVGRWLGPEPSGRPFESGPCRKGAVGIGYLVLRWLNPNYLWLNPKAPLFGG
jgi:hypothetical protein